MCDFENIILILIMALSQAKIGAIVLALNIFDGKGRLELRMTGQGSHPHILIAGAGLGGLTAALSCLEKGFDVDVFEQAPDLSEVGAGVQISPAGLRVLFALGLKEQIEKVWFFPEGREMRVWNTGYLGATRGMSSYLVGRYGLANIAIHRADLHSILVQAVRKRKPNALHVNSRVKSYEQSGEKVTLNLENGESFVGDVVVGADGIHSVIRKQMYGPSKPKFTGCIAWRGIVPSENLPPECRTPFTQNWMGVNGHFVCYPIRRGEMINIVGHIERSDWQVESWIEKGTHEEIASDFLGWHETVQTLINNIATPYKWGLFLHPTLEQWSQGRATLLGDACHSTLPYLGAGANMAIEDGYILARCLEKHQGDPGAALKQYEELRIPRTTKIVNESAANQHRFHSSELADSSKSKEYIDQVSANQLELRDWLFNYDATTVEV